MNTLWNRGIGFILAGAMLQSFCTLRLVLLSPLLNRFPEEILNLNNTAGFVFKWVIFTFLSKIIGAYVLGKYADSKGFLSAQKIIITGYVVTTGLLFLCCWCTTDFFSIQTAIFVNSCLSLFFFPATFMFPIMYLMKNYDVSNHVKISSLIILSVLTGHELSYYMLNYVADYNLRMMSGVFFCCSLLAGLVYCLGRASILSLEKPVAHTRQNQLQLLPRYSAKILAMLVGGVCGAVLYHHYFFIAPYILNVLILKDSGHEQAHILFYVTLLLFLIFSIKISDYLEQSKLRILSLVGILLLTFGVNIFQLSSMHVYIIYQTLLEFFFACFLTSSFGLIFSLFKDNQPFFNGTVWFYIGVSFSFLNSYILSEKFGPLHQHFLIMSPLVLNAALCLIALSIIRLPLVETSKKRVFHA